MKSSQIITFVTLLLISILFICGCTATKKKTKEVSFVFDNEHVLSALQTKQLDSLFRDHEKRTTNEIVLVTTPDYGSDSDMINFALNFGNKLGVGKKNLNNGAVIAFSKAKRETKISTGYGTEKVLTDVIAKKIIDSIMIPQFKKDKIFEGLWSGSSAIVDFLNKPENKITNTKN